MEEIQGTSTTDDRICFLDSSRIRSVLLFLTRVALKEITIF